MLQRDKHGILINNTLFSGSNISKKGKLQPAKKTNLRSLRSWFSIFQLRFSASLAFFFLLNKEKERRHVRFAMFCRALKIDTNGCQDRFEPYPLPSFCKQ